MKKQKRLESLTALRFLFFVFVFLSHYMMGENRVLPHGGAFAVVFFYMLSGFSMSYGYGDKIDDMPYGKFVKKRLVQLYPMQLVTHLLRAVPFLFIPLLSGVVDYEKITSFVLKLFFLEAWVPNENIIFGFNSCAWYLSPLVFCYFIFPLLFKWICKSSSKTLASAMLGYLFVYGICTRLIPEERQQVFIYAAPYFRFFDFALGIVLYRIVMSDYFHRIVDKITSWGGRNTVIVIANSNRLVAS